MSTFLAYTSPAMGHMAPLVPGLVALSDRGHEVHVRTAPWLVDDVRAAGLAAEGVDPGTLGPEPTDDWLPTEGGRLTLGLAYLMRHGTLERHDLERAIADVSPSALLIDTNSYGAAVGAERSGLPWATTLPSVLPMPGRGIPPYGLGMRPMRGPVGRVRDRIVWGKVESAYAAAMMPPLNRLRADAGLAPLAGPMDHLSSPDRLIVTTGEPLEYPRRDVPPHVRFVGPQLWDPPAASPAWLDEPGDPWVLVTCSTDFQGDDVLAAAAIEGLRDEPVRVVVTLADAHRAEMPAAPNARVERFVPHRPMLERAAVVVCPGGMGITQKAMVAGVPIVAVPFGRDQPEVARRITESGAGIRLPAAEITPDRLRETVRQAIALRPAAIRAGERLRASGGPARFADAAEELLGVYASTSSAVTDSSSA